MAFERRILTRYEADSRGFDRGTRRVNQQLTRLERNAAGRLQSIDRRFEKAARGAKRLGAAIAAFASIQGLRRLQSGIQGAIDKLDDIAKSADKIGLTTDALQELRVAADLSGVSTANLDNALRRFSRTVDDARQGTGEGAKAFERLEDALGRSIDLSQPLDALFNDVSDALANVEDTTERAALAGRVFGQRYGVELVNLLGKGSAAIDAMRAKARELGVVIDEDLIRRSVEAKDELTLISKVIDANVTVALANLGPTLVKLSEFFASLAAVLPGSAEEMETFATALQTTAVAAAAVAGGRGIRAVNAALVESAQARRAEVAASQAAVAQAQREVRARRSALTTLQLQTVQRARSAAGIKNVEAANKRLVSARTALTTAETTAAAATDRLTAAQARLSAATRITTGAMTALRRAFVFLGGVPGILIGVASAAFLLSDAFQSQADRLDALQGKFADVESSIGKVRKVEQDLERDTEALKAANERLTTAIETQGQAAQDTARLEIDAINSRIAKNKELRAEFELLIKAQLAQARAALELEERAFRRPFERQALTTSERGEASLPGGGQVLERESVRARAEALIEQEIKAIDQRLEAGDPLTPRQNEILELRAKLADARIEADGLEQSLSALGETVAPAPTPTPTPTGGGGASATKEETDALEELIAASDQRAFQLLDEIQLTKAAAGEVTFLTEKQRLLAFAKENDIALNQQIAGTNETVLDRINALARSYADISEELDKVTAARELVDQAAERELTTTEKITRANERLTALLPQLIELTGDQAEAERILADAKRDVAEKIREAEEDPSIKRLADDLGTAISQAESLEDALESVLKKLAEIALQAALQSALSGGNAPTGSNPFAGIFNSIFSSFDQGGPTGGRRDQVAGVVHGQEFVVRAGPAQEFRPLLEAINDKRIPGFATGGFVSPTITNEIAVPRDIGQGRGMGNVTVEGSTIVLQGSDATPEELERVLDRRDRQLVERIVRMNDRNPEIFHT